MDFAIAAAPGRPHRQSDEASPLASTSPPSVWEVLLLRQDRGNEVVSRLASFGHRQHAEAFLADFLAQVRPSA